MQKSSIAVYRRMQKQHRGLPQDAKAASRFTAGCKRAIAGAS
jgi:hypothetical protein